MPIGCVAVAVWRKVYVGHNLRRVMNLGQKEMPQQFLQHYKSKLHQRCMYFVIQNMKHQKTEMKWNVCLKFWKRFHNLLGSYTSHSGKCYSVKFTFSYQCDRNVNLLVAVTNLGTRIEGVFIIFFLLGKRRWWIS